MELSDQCGFALRKNPQNLFEANTVEAAFWGWEIDDDFYFCKRKHKPAFVNLDTLYNDPNR